MTPPTWLYPRNTPIFLPPVQVEQFRDGTYRDSPAALAALAKDWRPGFEQDRTHVQGKLRLTLPVSGSLVLLGRARGDPARLLLDGAGLQLSWLGLDAGQIPPWPVRLPRGWHPFAVRVQAGPLALLDTGGLKFSLLVCRRTVTP